LEDSSALFRHEVAFVLGQLQNPIACQALAKSLENKDENCMVRHEAAEALGAIANEGSVPLLEKYSTDTMQVVKESCLIALDIHDYFTSDEFQYPFGHSKLEATYRL
jgi:deoxyhypusine monooxygenase